jgi:hypothetical protein
MPGYGYYEYRPLPIKALHDTPRHYTYRRKLEAKWRDKGYAVRFA